MRFAVLLAMFAIHCPAVELPQQTPPAALPVVEIKGTITKISLGAGMPCLKLRVDGKEKTVVLGAMRYLMEKDFNPKIGIEAKVSGRLLSESEVIAISVELPSEGRTIQLRDKDGWPLWRGGRYGGAHHDEMHH